MAPLEKDPLNNLSKILEDSAAAIPAMNKSLFKASLIRATQHQDVLDRYILRSCKFNWTFHVTQSEKKRMLILFKKQDAGPYNVMKMTLDFSMSPTKYLPPLLKEIPAPQYNWIPPSFINTDQKSIQKLANKFEKKDPKKCILLNVGIHKKKLLLIAFPDGNEKKALFFYENRPIHSEGKFTINMFFDFCSALKHGMQNEFKGDKSLRLDLLKKDEEIETNEVKKIIEQIYEGYQLMVFPKQDIQKEFKRVESLLLSFNKEKEAINKEKKANEKEKEAIENEKEAIKKIYTRYQQMVKQKQDMQFEFNGDESLLLSLTKNNEVKKYIKQIYERDKQQMLQNGIIHYKVKDFIADVTLRLKEDGTLAWDYDKDDPFQMQLHLSIQQQEGQPMVQIKTFPPDFLTGGALYQKFLDAVFDNDTKESSTKENEDISAMEQEKKLNDEERMELEKEKEEEINREGGKTPFSVIKNKFIAAGWKGGTVDTIFKQSREEGAVIFRIDRKRKFDTNLFVLFGKVGPHQNKHHALVFLGKFKVRFKEGEPEVSLLRKASLKVLYDENYQPITGGDMVEKYFRKLTWLLKSWVDLIV